MRKDIDQVAGLGFGHPQCPVACPSGTKQWQLPGHSEDWPQKVERQPFQQVASLVAAMAMMESVRKTLAMKSEIGRFDMV